MPIHVTRHAIERAMERIEGVTSEAEARDVLTGAIIHIAADLAGVGDCFVRLATGQRICVRDHTVVTVIPCRKVRKHFRGDRDDCTVAP